MRHPTLVRARKKHGPFGQYLSTLDSRQTHKEAPPSPATPVATRPADPELDSRSCGQPFIAVFRTPVGGIFQLCELLQISPRSRLCRGIEPAACVASEELQRVPVVDVKTVNRKKSLDMKTIEALWPPWMIMDTPAEKVDDVYRFTIRGPKTRVDAETELLRQRYAEAGKPIRISRVMATMAEVEAQEDPWVIMCAD